MSLYPTAAPLQIAVPSGPLPPALAAVLTRQRAEEPESPVRLVETTEQERLEGLEDGRYCLSLGLSLASGQQPLPQDSLALWKDELAVAVPLLSPLLAFPEIPLKDAAKYPLILWHPECYGAVGQQIEALLASAVPTLQVAERVRSFELMAVVVSAGYGIGFAALSRIVAARKLEIAMRPLAGGPHTIVAYLTQPRAPLPAPVKRLVGRFQALAAH